jgi:hypothetical protein
VSDEPKTTAPEDGSPNDPRFTAAITMLRRTGSTETQIRYDEEQDPLVWVCVGKWGEVYEAEAGMTPLIAATRLAERVSDGGTCAYCARPTALTDDWKSPTLMDDTFCWWVYDPETQEYRRGCEGEQDEKKIKAYPGVSRNDPCPCGSGKKYKKCHGA